MKKRRKGADGGGESGGRRRWRWGEGEEDATPVELGHGCGEEGRREGKSGWGKRGEGTSEG